MKKNIFALLLAMMLLVCASASAMTAGTYEAEAQGMMGMVKVAVTVTESAIQNVEVIAQNETAGLADPALANVPAAIVAEQSLAVDTVSGATKTTKAYRDAVALAIETIEQIKGGD